MTAVFLVPLCDGRVLVHVLDDVTPADAGVVCTERDLAFLCAIRDDAHLCAAEVVVEKILEPHAGDEEEVPRVLPALLDVFHRALRSDLSIILTGKTTQLDVLSPASVQYRRM